MDRATDQGACQVHSGRSGHTLQLPRHEAKDYMHKGGFLRDVPLLDDVIIMNVVGHFINQEKKR